MKTLILLLFISLSTLCISQSIGDVTAMNDTATLADDTVSEAPPVIPVDQLPVSWQGPAALIGLVLMIVGRVAYGMKTGKNFWEALSSAIFKGNNQKVPMWAVLLLGASLLTSCAPTGMVTGIEYDGTQVCAKGKVSFVSPVPLNQDSLLDYVKNKYIVLQHLKDSGDVRNYEWRICSPESLLKQPQK